MSEEHTPTPENLRAAYQALCTSYNAIDDFRHKLLGYLPLGSGAIFALFSNEKVATELIPLIGLLGFLTTFALYIFEIYGIRRCTHLIILGEYLERQMKVEGQFSHRPRGLKYLLRDLPREPRGKKDFSKKEQIRIQKFIFRFLGLISEPMAAGIIYPTVGSAWLYIFLNGIPKVSPNCVSKISLSVPELLKAPSFWGPLLFLLATIIASFKFNWWLTYHDALKKKRQLTLNRLNKAIDRDKQIINNR